MLSRTKLAYTLLHDLSQMTRGIALRSKRASESPHLSPNSIACLDFLLSDGPQTAGNIAKHLGLTSGATTTLLTKLAEDGFIRRKADPYDLRKTIIHPVLKKLKQRSDRMSTLEQQLVATLDQYSLEEVAIITDFLRKVRSIYEPHVS